ncbi:MAG: DUF4349 domain-containing protein [Phycisphaerales bacterium]
MNPDDDAGDDAGAMDDGDRAGGGDGWSDARLSRALRSLAADGGSAGEGAGVGERDGSLLEAALRDAGGDRSLAGDRGALRDGRGAGGAWFGSRRLAVAAAVALSLTGSFMLLVLPSLSGARRAAPVGSRAVMEGGSAPAMGGVPGDAGRDGAEEAVSAAPAIGQAVEDGSAPSLSGLGRLVIRDASMRVRVEDVDGALDRVRSMVHPEAGEFVESMRRSSTHEAVLVLKVESARLSTVVDEVVSLGEVLDVQMSGRDVTDQAVDLNARIRNAERVEDELLGLLDSRDDPPLRDVLEVQRELGEARERVERLVAQRDGLLRMASLATLRVVVFAEREADGGGDGAGFGAAMGDAWRDGVSGLRATIAFLVRAAVGGAVAWVLIGIALVLVWRAQGGGDAGAGGHRGGRGGYPV